MTKEKHNNNYVDSPSGSSDVVVGKELLINALKCVDAAAARGSYRGGELSMVGSVRDALYVLVADEVEAMMSSKED